MKRDKYMGMDVHQATTVVAVMNGDGKIVLETMVPTKAAPILELIETLSGPLHVTLEEGTQAEWLHEVIRDWVKEVVVCDRKRNKLLQEGIVNLSDFMAISLTPMAAMLLILGPGSCRFCPENKRILVKLTVPVESLGEEDPVARALNERIERAREEKMKVRSADAGRPWTDYTVISPLSVAQRCHQCRDRTRTARQLVSGLQQQRSAQRPQDTFTPAIPPGSNHVKKCRV